MGLNSGKILFPITLPSRPSDMMRTGEIKASNQDNIISPSPEAKRVLSTVCHTFCAAEFLP